MTSSKQPESKQKEFGWINLIIWILIAILLRWQVLEPRWIPSESMLPTLEVNEKVWRMPLNNNYDKMLNCDVADMKNISSGRGAGSITAGQFLQRFVGKTPWAHLDIAGMAFPKKASNLSSTRASGFGVRLLNEFVEKNYE